MPAPTPDQEKLTKLVNKFRGISQYCNIAQSSMDHAIDLMNVMISGIGNLEKFRSPAALTAGPPVFTKSGIQPLIDTMVMFTQGNGARQLFFNAGPGRGYYTDPETGALLVFTQVADQVAVSRTRYVQSNNLLFGVNGYSAFKWTGTLYLLWGLPVPPAAPLLGISLPLTSISRSAGGVITFGFSVAPITASYGQLSSAISTISTGLLYTISNVKGDTTLNGSYTATGINTLSGVGGATGPFINDGNITIYTSLMSFALGSVRRQNGTIDYTFPNNSAIGLNILEQVTVAGLAGGLSSLNGTFNLLLVLGITANTDVLCVSNGGTDIAPIAATGGSTIVGGFSSTVSPRTYRFSWAITTTGEEGPASPATLNIPLANAATIPVSNIRAYLTIPTPPAGYGIDSFFIYANQDGGGIWLTVPGPNPDESWPLVVPGTPTYFTDAIPDSSFDAAFAANFINFPPPQDMKFVQKWQGRIYGGGMPEDPQAIVYSGFDQIYRGRPESSWPPLNRIQLAIGADALAGFGVLLNGVVAWDVSNKMYMFSGVVQDIVTTQPVQIADQLEEEPWQVGLASADSVQSTPKGLVWVGADLSVQIWNGIFYGEIIGPRDLSINFYPYMRRITPSTRPFIQSAFFNWLERDWYVLLAAVDGSVTPNRMFFFDLGPDGADNMGIWVTNIEADSIAVKVTSDGTRTLVASIKGVVCSLQVSSTSTSGIHQNITATNSELDAYWDSGWWQDEPHMTKMYRYGRLTTDQSGFRLLSTVLNDETTRFRDRNPYQQLLKLSPGGRFAVNRRGRRQKFRIEFPSADVDASVLELYTTAIPLADI